jgi:hypothetical protein
VFRYALSYEVFRRGLYSDTSNGSRHKPEENVLLNPIERWGSNNIGEGQIYNFYDNEKVMHKLIDER